jgi:myo-inositol-1-phosphate synthase
VIKFIPVNFITSFGKLKGKLGRHIEEIIKDKLNQHEKRLDVLEKDNITNAVEIKRWCRQIASLVGTLKWFTGVT